MLVVEGFVGFRRAVFRFSVGFYAKIRFDSRLRPLGVALERFGAWCFIHTNQDGLQRLRRLQINSIIRQYKKILETTRIFLYTNRLGF